MALDIILGFAIIYGAGAKMFHVRGDPVRRRSGNFGKPDHDRSDDQRLGVHLGRGSIRDVARGWMNVAVMIESIMGTLLFGLFIVAFSRKVIR